MMNVAIIPPYVWTLWVVGVMVAVGLIIIIAYLKNKKNIKGTWIVR